MLFFPWRKKFVSTFCRFFESGVYEGFTHDVVIPMLCQKFAWTTDSLIPLRVYTPGDIGLWSKQKTTKSGHNKESKDSFYLLSRVFSIVCLLP